MTDDFEKLKKLLEHWKFHNKEHAENYKLWANKMELLGKKEVARILYEVYNQSLKQNELFEKALNLKE
ncbi:MAG: hypothetical protein OHK0040_01770 [bacterium]